MSSSRNKFDSLMDQIQRNDDMLVTSEIKLDESFPEGQFKLSRFTAPIGRDRNKFGGGFMVFVREDIPSKLISLNIEGIFFELTFC